MVSMENLNLPTEDFDGVYRLPDNVVPIKYKLIIDPDLEAATFIGDLVLDLHVKEATRKILLNSHGLTVKSVRLCHTSQDSSTDPSSVTHYSIRSVFLQNHRQLMVLLLESVLPVGNYSIFMKYEGVLNSESHGLYRTWINGQSESPRYCMASYFEPTYARFAYPCFDEPHFKAKYLVSLIKPVSDDYVALSNSAVKIEANDWPREGVTTVHFEETPPISSYLTCFIVGVFARLDPTTALGGKVPVSVYSQPDLVQDTATALSLAANILDFFSSYFQIDYPFPKLDLIAVPDSRLGGMENWGLITFRETGLLLATQEASTNDLVTVVSVIAHELSHMWFGNLVTIAWWNDLWLKEGMANFMSYVGGNFIYPSWYNEWVLLRSDVFPALLKDSALSSRPVVLGVSHPDQIREMFDSISYRKGCCLIRMLQDVDRKGFDKGLKIYLKKMMWGEARSADLWQCLSETMDLTVGSIMGPWTEEPGYPLITLSPSPTNPLVYVLTQSRFIKAGGRTSSSCSSAPSKSAWDVPIKYVTSGDSENIKFIWFHRDDESAMIDCGRGTEWIKLNWHCVGFYRVNYPHSMWMQFADLLLRDPTRLPAEDRSSLVNDAWCLAKEGYIQYDIPLSLLRYLSEGKEPHFITWTVVKSHLDTLKSLLSSNQSSTQLYQKYMQKLMGPLMSNLNWDTSETVPFVERKARVEMIEVGCLLGFEFVLEKIRSLFTDWIDKKKTKPCPEIRTLLHSYGISGNASEALWDKTREQYLQERNPADILNYLRSLASTTNPQLINRLFMDAKNPDVVKSQDFFILLNLIAKSSVGNQLVWSFIRTEWEYLVSRFSVNDQRLGEIVASVLSHFSSPHQLTEVEDFFAKYPDAGAGASERRHAIETIKTNIGWKNQNQEFLDSWFSKL